MERSPEFVIRGRPNTVLVIAESRRSELIRRAWIRVFVFQSAKISVFATSHKTFRHRLQFLPAFANDGRLSGRDLIVRRRRGNHREEISKLLHDLIRRWNQKRRMRPVAFGIENEKTAGALADP